MTKFISNTTLCAYHGLYIGRECPLCDSVPFSEPPPPKPEQDRSKWHRGPEKELHDWLETWLDRHEVSYVHARTDVKSTIQNGFPDFLCFRATGEIVLTCLVEFKNRTGKLRKDQVTCIADLAKRGIKVLVTGDFTEACAYVTKELCLPTTEPATN